MTESKQLRGRAQGMVPATMTSRVCELETELATCTARLATLTADRERDIACAVDCAQTASLARIGHELRTPLTAIIGFAELLEMGHPRQDQDAAVAAILAAAESLLCMVNNVLDITGMEAGLGTPAIEAVDLVELLGDCVDVITPQASEGNVDITTMPIGDGARYIRGERAHLMQVVGNLLSNAVKYNRRGGRVRIHVTGGDGNRIRISIADTGRGVPAGRMTAAFQPFERLGAEATTVPGAGLGLSLVRRLVSAMDGQVGAEAGAAGGSVFWVELPRSDGLLVMPPAADCDATQPGGEATP